MEYDFFPSSLGSPIAEFSSGFEAIGDWMSNDIGADVEVIEQLLTMIDQLENRQKLEHEFISAQYLLHMDQHEVELKFKYDVQYSTQLTAEEEHAMSIENGAGCGLTDLKIALQKWREYINGKSY